MTIPLLLGFHHLDHIASLPSPFLLGVVTYLPFPLPFSCSVTFRSSSPLSSGSPRFRPSVGPGWLVVVAQVWSDPFKSATEESSSKFIFGYDDYFQFISIVFFCLSLSLIVSKSNYPCQFFFIMLGWCLVVLGGQQKDHHRFL